MGYLSQNITDYDIQALIDNELGWEEEKIIRACINRNALYLKRYNELLKQKHIIQNWWQTKAE